jgi:hypothetical protein
MEVSNVIRANALLRAATWEFQLIAHVIPAKAGICPSWLFDNLPNPDGSPPARG